MIKFKNDNAMADIGSGSNKMAISVSAHSRNVLTEIMY
jgi:hypothetical protein